MYEEIIEEAYFELLKTECPGCGITAQEKVCNDCIGDCDKCEWTEGEMMVDLMWINYGVAGFHLYCTCGCDLGEFERTVAEDNEAAIRY